VTSDSLHVGLARNVLRDSRLFGGLPPDQCEEVLDGGREQLLSRGQMLYALDTHERFHIVLDGRIKLVRASADGSRELVLFLLGPGEGFDIVTLLDGKAHDFSAVAVDDCAILSTSISNVRSWIDRHDGFNRRFLPYLGEQMNALADLASGLALHETHVRLAKLLLDHVDQHSEGRGPCLVNDLSHETIAAMIGTVRQVVNRHLQALKKAGAVDFRRGRLEIKNAERLLERCTASLLSKANVRLSKGQGSAFSL
jgi:CRP/FNR family cyclic AMP-dependent transcriptional regulator